MKYTPEEIAALLANRPNQPHYVKALIGKCVKAAVLAEREACAKLCDNEKPANPWKPVSSHLEGQFEMAGHLAERIRARGQQ